MLYRPESGKRTHAGWMPCEQMAPALDAAEVGAD